MVEQRSVASHGAEHLLHVRVVRLCCVKQADKHHCRVAVGSAHGALALRALTQLITPRAAVGWTTSTPSLTDEFLSALKVPCSVAWLP